MSDYTCKTVAESIVPGIHCEQQPEGTQMMRGWAAYYVPMIKCIVLKDPLSTDLEQLICAAHEAHHALRHIQGHPFYEEGMENENERTLEDFEVRKVTLEWCLQNLNPPYTRKEIFACDQTFNPGFEALRLTKGYVSRWSGWAS
jgi:hypothetical protein